MTYYSVSVEAAGVVDDGQTDTIAENLADRGGVVSTDGRNTAARFTVSASTPAGAVDVGTTAARVAWRAAGARFRVVAVETITHAELDRRLAG